MNFSMCFDLRRFFFISAKFCRFFSQFSSLMVFVWGRNSKKKNLGYMAITFKKSNGDLSVT
jgi:hypothetical protein